MAVRNDLFWGNESCWLNFEGRQGDWLYQRRVKCHLPSLVQLVSQYPEVKAATALKVGDNLNQAILLVLVLTKDHYLPAVKDFLACQFSP
ncbi:UNVERIFIED_CONTAM: hypothetical protein KB579_04895 [Streptococcus canis]|uniref:hypothetical protein n=1 Tax=Streptococcus canis TaxID=1329 RepID=UPI0024DE55AF|nr:hypothetical protein [Streptococcus canis]